MRALLRTLGGSRLGGIPSFSAAASEIPSAAPRVESAVIARFPIAISFLGQLDHAGGLGCEVAARHCPQFKQIVVPPAGSAAGHRMDGMFARPSRDHATCSVSRAQPEQ
jgi:hypothetical protein